MDTTTRPRRNLCTATVFWVNWGWIGLGRSATGLARCTLPTVSEEAARAALGVADVARAGADDDLLASAVVRLQSYFAGSPVRFDLPLDLDGYPPFTTQVLRQCASIAYGETVTYGALALRAGYPAAARAVGQVMARNPLAIVIPCHRVVGAARQLVGFGGGIDMKAALLALEAQSPGGSSVAVWTR